MAFHLFKALLFRKDQKIAINANSTIHAFLKNIVLNFSEACNSKKLVISIAFKHLIFLREDIYCYFLIQCCKVIPPCFMLCQYSFPHMERKKKLLVFHFWNRNAFISPLNLKKAEIKPEVTFSSLINLFPFFSSPIDENLFLLSLL